MEEALKKIWQLVNSLLPSSRSSSRSQSPAPEDPNQTDLLPKSPLPGSWPEADLSPVETVIAEAMADSPDLQIDGTPLPVAQDRRPISPASSPYTDDTAEVAISPLYSATTSMEVSGLFEEAQVAPETSQILTVRQIPVRPIACFSASVL